MNFELRISNFELARRRRGFTLIELLLAMFILAIGLVAIASLFPVAGTLQRAAADQTIARDLKSSITALLEARGISEADLGSNAYTSVSRVPQDILRSSGTANIKWTLANRCYPMAIDADNDSIPNEAAGSVSIGGQQITAPLDPDGSPDPEDDDFDQRIFYWVPLVMDKDPTAARDWQVFVFVLRTGNDVEYPSKSSSYANQHDGDTIPGVVEVNVSSMRNGNVLEINHNGDIEPGDQILGDNGVPYQVDIVDGDSVTVAGFIDVKPNKVWYGKRATGKSSPTRLILQFGAEAIK